MGFIFSKSMNENMKRQQEFMLMNTRLQAPGSFTLAPYSSLIFCLGILVFLICILAGSSHGLCPSGKLERQLIMQNEMRERQMAMQIAWSREFLKYFGTFFGIASVALTAGAIKRKKPAFFLPIIPLGFVFTYQYDLGYGTLLQRMKGEAENILETETSKLQLPKGMITFEGLEKARREQSKFFIDK